MNLPTFKSNVNYSGSLDVLRNKLQQVPAHAALRHDVQLDEYKSFDLANPLVDIPKTGIREVDEKMMKTNRRFSGVFALTKKGVFDTVKSTIQGAFYGGLVGFLTTGTFFLFTLIGVVAAKRKIPSNYLRVIGVMSGFGAALGAMLRGGNAISRSVDRFGEALTDNFIR